MKLTLAPLLAASALAFASLAPCVAQAQPDEDTKIWRLQVKFLTADVENAGTDDEVHVSLNGDNDTWLDHARNDFERGDYHTYDLKLDNVATLADITRLRIRKTGSDGWCLRRVKLYVNGATIFQRDYDSCRWLDNEGGHSRTLRFSSATLRANAYWEGWTDPTSSPLRLSRSSIEHIVEGLVGDIIHGEPDVYWGNRHGSKYVAASRLNATDLRFDIDLAVDAETICPFSDPDLDVDFDLRFACDAGVVTITPRNVSAVVDCIWIANPDLSDDLPTIAFETNDFGICPDITIEADGDVVFSVPGF